MNRFRLTMQLAILGLALAVPSAADAIPAFARKYETSCLTCHTVYPKLTPFGEAFRRNGYRFPGVDSDYVKQGTVPLGQEANKKTFPRSVWPATLPISSVIAIGANGRAFAYPQKSATIPRQNNDVRFSLDDLVSEGHLWAGASLDDTITIWAEVTVGGGAADVEHAQVLLNDLVGPKHAVNLVVGRGFPTLTSFGPHSSYLGDALITTVPVTGIYRALGQSVHAGGQLQRRRADRRLGRPARLVRGCDRREERVRRPLRQRERVRPRRLQARRHAARRGGVQGAGERAQAVGRGRADDRCVRLPLARDPRVGSIHRPPPPRGTPRGRSALRLAGSSARRS